METRPVAKHDQPTDTRLHTAIVYEDHLLRDNIAGRESFDEIRRAAQIPAIRLQQAGPSLCLSNELCYLWAVDRRPITKIVIVPSELPSAGDGRVIGSQPSRELGVSPQSVAMLGLVGLKPRSQTGGHCGLPPLVDGGLPH